MSPRFTSTSPSIPGYSLARAGVGQATRAVLIAAGRDLARINAAPVAGFGWVRRDRPAVTALAAGHPALPGFVREHLDSDLALLGA